MVDHRPKYAPRGPFVPPPNLFFEVWPNLHLVVFPVQRRIHLYHCQFNSHFDPVGIEMSSQNIKASRGIPIKWVWLLMRLVDTRLQDGLSLL